MTTGDQTNLFTGVSDSGEFDAAAMILAFINVGRLLELRAKHSAGSAVAALSRRIPASVQLVTPDGIKPTPLERIRAGDQVRIAVDTIIPVDGEIVDLNRIALPANTPIIDERFKAETKK